MVIQERFFKKFRDGCDIRTFVLETPRWYKNVCCRNSEVMVIGKEVDNQFIETFVSAILMLRQVIFLLELQCDHNKSLQT